MRPEVEKPQELLDLAQNDSVALLIVGDPLQATTHIDLQLQAEEKGIDCHVIHGISITNLRLVQLDYQITSLVARLR